jgi:glycosyltransferase involved in cell wall biosynthesis
MDGTFLQEERNDFMIGSNQTKDQSTPNKVSDAPADFRALVCQLGAREHYLVARCLARQGLLACMATDFWSPVRPAQGRIFRRLPKVVLSAMARHHPDLEGQRVASFPFLSLARYGLAMFDKKGRRENWIARRFARAVGKLRVPHNVFFGYSYDSLELLQAGQQEGVFTMLCQTDPGPAHYRMIAEEEKRWPEYCIFQKQRWVQERAERLRQEWDLADVIIVNSAWTRDSIVSAGAPASKIEILPLAYEVKAEKLKSETLKPDSMSACQDVSVSAFSPLRVLWLGNVALGKGIQYLMEAARLLAREPIEFLVAGNLFIAPGIMNSSQKNIRWLGRIPRSATSQLYQTSDVFVFPTLSDGFGITQLEAMAHGIPVIATPNCGQVVEDGKTGFIVSPRDPQALADAIRKFVTDRNLSPSMAPACRESAAAYSVESYGQRLVEIIKKHSACR